MTLNNPRIKQKMSDNNCAKYCIEANATNSVICVA